MANMVNVTVAIGSAISSGNQAVNNNGLTMVNAAGQAIGAVASLTPYGLGITLASTEVTFMKITIDATNGDVQAGDIISLTAGTLGLIAGTAIIIGAAPAIGTVATIAAVAQVASMTVENWDAIKTFIWSDPATRPQDTIPVFHPICTPDDTDGNGIDDLVDEINKKFADSQEMCSPIVLDLNGDGLSTTAVGSGTYFDHDTNGFAEASGWVNAQDGILARDLNGNGTIDNGHELFGSETLLANGQKAANGYAALAELDTNNDGQINAQEAANANIKIWKDSNGDGYSSADELISLADAGVQSIATSYTATNQTDPNGNTIKQTSTFTKTDGSTGNSADIWFAVNKTNTIATDWLPETAAVAALPDLQGYGNMRDLHQAILRDNSGHLQDLVQQFIAETDLAARHILVNQLLYAWADAENISPDSRGYISDARQLYVLEAFMGENYVQGYGWNAGTGNAGWNAGAYLTGIYNELAAGLYSQLMAQTHLKPLLDSIAVTWDGTTNQFDWDITNTVALLQDRYTNGDPDNSIAELADALKLNGDSGAQVQSDAANDAVFNVRSVG